MKSFIFFIFFFLIFSLFAAEKKIENLTTQLIGIEKEKKYIEEFFQSFLEKEKNILEKIRENENSIKHSQLVISLHPKDSKYWATIALEQKKLSQLEQEKQKIFQEKEELKKEITKLEKEREKLFLLQKSTELELEETISFSQKKIKEFLSFQDKISHAASFYFPHVKSVMTENELSLSFLMRPNASILSPEEGTIIFIGPLGGMGNSLIIEHKWRYVVILGEADFIEKVGSKVLKGQFLGKAKQTWPSKVSVEIRNKKYKKISLDIVFK